MLTQILSPCDGGPEVTTWHTPPLGGSDTQRGAVRAWSTRPAEPPLEKLRRELRTKMVTAWDAYRCCRAHGFATRRFLQGFASFAESFDPGTLYAGPPVRLPGPSFWIWLFSQRPSTPPVTPPVTAPFLPFVMFDDGVVREPPPELTAGLLELYDADPSGKALRALDRHLERFPVFDCAKCARRRSKRQNKKRVRAVALSKDPRIDGNRLMLRIHHK